MEYLDVKNLRVGNGYDVHRLGEGLPLVLGGITIPHTKGCVAHSDGDVVIHALCDAILGAMNLGDIGKHFPDNDVQYKNIDSKILLTSVMALIAPAEIINVDITLLLQSPKIGHYFPTMQKVLAPILQINENNLSLKATTGEKIGFVGREEGIAVMATVLLYKHLSDKF